MVPAITETDARLVNVGCAREFHAGQKSALAYARVRACRTTMDVSPLRSGLHPARPQARTRAAARDLVDITSNQHR